MGPKVCGTITELSIGPILKVASLIDIYEVRIDLLGDGWRNVIPSLKKPWIACGGSKEDLFEAADKGARYVDVGIESTSLASTIGLVKQRACCIVSYHSYLVTPPFRCLDALVAAMRSAGADICKVVTAACSIEDNLTMVNLVRKWREKDIIAFAMGDLGIVSRVLCPLVGGYLTYGYITKPSAPGQLHVSTLRRMYESLWVSGTTGQVFPLTGDDGGSI